MRPHSLASASGRTRRMMLLILLHLVCLGRNAASSVKNGQSQVPQQVENPASDPNNSNSSKIVEGINNKPDKSHRQSRALPRFENLEAVQSSEEEAFIESVQKSPSEVSSLYVIPHLRPGRTSDESNQLEDIDEQEIKRNSYTATPMVLYGRSDSLIPIPRSGRYVELSDVSKSDLSLDNILDNQSPNKEDIFKYDVLEQSKRHNVIPIPRYGRSESIIPMPRFEGSDSIIPKIRFGRSDLIPTARYGRSDSLIPMARYGRSDSLIPMARYGRSDSLIPIPRFGKSIKSFENPDYYSKGIESEGSSEAEYTFETFKPSKRSIGDSGAMIPYPRPGREVDELESSDSEERPQTNGSLIPQIRYGRSSGKAKIPESEQSHIFILPNIRPGRSPKNGVSNKEKENSKSIQYGLLPYPRPGRSSDSYKNNMDKNYDYLNENTDSFNEVKRFEESTIEQLVLDSDLEEEIFDTDILKSGKEQNVISTDPDGSRFVIPYPRPGKRAFNEGKESTVVLPSDVNNYPHLFKINKRNSDDNVNSLRYLNARKENVELVSDEPQENEKQLKKDTSTDYVLDSLSKFQKRSILFDKPRLILPYSRLGRSSSLLPYPRLGRSNSILPFPRPGRSSSVLPYPRPGRSTNILPYPRPGRSTSILPYPRPGRSLNVVPYPRPGRSDNILPYPRPGRSDLILPNPRPGRSKTILPHPRLGRSTTVLPYPRPGRSTFDELESPYFETLILEDGLKGDSYKLKDIPSLTKKLNKEISESNSVYILPYPRPGRALKRNDA